jgi:hypothetical protein
MRNSRSLPLLRETLLRSLGRLSERHSVLTRVQRTSTIYHQAGLLPIEMMSAWTNFARSYTLSLACRPKRITGSRVTVSPNITCPQDLLNHAIMTLNPRARRRRGVWQPLDEPRWRNISVIRQVAQSVSASNFAEIATAETYVSNIWKDLPDFRNFFAHRDERSCKTVQQLGPRYGMSSLRDPAAILLDGVIGGQPLFHAWVDDLENVSELLCH